MPFVVVNRKTQTQICILRCTVWYTSFCKLRAWITVTQPYCMLCSSLLPIAAYERTVAVLSYRTVRCCSRCRSETYKLMLLKQQRQSLQLDSWHKSSDTATRLIERHASTLFCLNSSLYLSTVQVRSIFNTRSSITSKLILERVLRIQMSCIVVA